VVEGGGGKFHWGNRGGIRVRKGERGRKQPRGTHLKKATRKRCRMRKLGMAGFVGVLKLQAKGGALFHPWSRRRGEGRIVGPEARGMKIEGKNMRRLSNITSRTTFIRRRAYVEISVKV